MEFFKKIQEMPKGSLLEEISMSQQRFEKYFSRLILKEKLINECRSARLLLEQIEKI